MPIRKQLKVYRYIFGFVLSYFFLQLILAELPAPVGMITIVFVYVLFTVLAMWVLDVLVPYLNFFSSAPARLPPESEAKNWIALTFDDGPVQPYTSQILDILKKEKVKATFFCVGKRIEENFELARRIAAEGHTLANHSYTHEVLPFLSQASVQKDLEQSTELIRRAIGSSPKFFRCPKGYKSRRIQKQVEAAGMRMVGFSYPMFDIENPPPSELIQRAEKKFRAGDMILFHDGYRDMKEGAPSSLVQALPAILETIRKKGLKTVTLDEVYADQKLSSAA